MVPIHPLFARSQWLGSEQPMGNGRLGKWCVRSNERLWDALGPVLRLAGLMMGRSESLWQDAMWNGAWLPVPCNDGCPPGRTVAQAYEFRTRKPHERPDDWRETVTRMKEMLVKRLTFCFEDKPGEPNLAYGYMKPSFPDSRDLRGNVTKKFYGKIVLCTDYMVSLMTDAMSTSERLAQNHLIAKTIVHECMHASMYLSRELRPLSINGSEAFFENEGMAEAGFSWENFAFGGAASHISTGTPGSKTYNPILAEFIAPWPNWFCYSAGEYDAASGQRCRYPEQFHHLQARYERWPVSMTFIENLQQVGLWTGHLIPEEAFRGPQILGKCLLNDVVLKTSKDIWDRQYTILGKDHYRWALGPPGQVQPVPEEPVDARSLMKFGYELALATRAASIRVSMMRKDDGVFNTRNLEALENDPTLTPEEIAKIQEIAVTQISAKSREMIDERQKLEDAQKWYDRGNEAQCSWIYQNLIRSDNRSTCAFAALKLSRLMSVSLLEQIKICQKAIDELMVLTGEDPVWYPYLTEAESHIKALFVRKSMNNLSQHIMGPIFG